MKYLYCFFILVFSMNCFAAARYGFCDVDGHTMIYNNEKVTYSTECFKVRKWQMNSINKFCSNSYADYIKISDSARNQKTPFLDVRRDQASCETANSLHFLQAKGYEYDIFKYEGKTLFRFYLDR